MTKGENAAQEAVPNPVPAAEPVVSLQVFLEGREASAAEGVVLQALYADRKLTRAGWLELAASEMQREVR